MECPAAYRLNRLIRSVRQTHETRVFQELTARLDPPMRQRLDAVLADQDDREPVFQDLRADPGRVGLESLLKEIEKLKTIRDLGLPADILASRHSGIVPPGSGQAVPPAGRDRKLLGASAASGGHPPALAGILLHAAGGRDR